MKQLAYTIFSHYPCSLDSVDVHSILIFEGEQLLSVYRLEGSQVSRLTGDLNKLGFKCINPLKANIILDKRFQELLRSDKRKQLLELALESSQTNLEKAEWNLATWSSCSIGISPLNDEESLLNIECPSCDFHFKELIHEVECAQAVYQIIYEAYSAVFGPPK